MIKKYGKQEFWVRTKAEATAEAKVWKNKGYKTKITKKTYVVGRPKLYNVCAWKEKGNANLIK